MLKQQMQKTPFGWFYYLPNLNSGDNRTKIKDDRLDLEVLFYAKSMIVNPDHKYSELTGKIIGLCMKVPGEFGNRFQEVISSAALKLSGEFEMPIFYDDIQLGTRRVDFLVNNKVMVELKVIIQLEDVNLAQAINYLEAYNLEIGLLINFGSRSLDFKRLQNNKYKSD